MKILITSALPYANGAIHFGHIAGAYLPGDCYARFERLLGNEVLYICGSDEYGVAITLSAELAHRTPQEQVDIYHKINSDLFNKLKFSFDHYSRTTSSIHRETVQAFFKELLEGGFIEERVEKHLYSEKEKRFLADRYVVGTCPKCGFEAARGDECTKCGASYEALDIKNPRSKISNDPLVLRPSKHWYMRFDKFKDKLEEWLSKKKWKQNVLSFAKNYVDELKPRAITRDLEWGIPVPLEEAKGKVLYVWFDAPIGYISATKEWAEKKGNKDLWKEFWLNPEAKLIHFIGKDNIPFHTVFFPAMLMGQREKYKLPDEVPANEFFLLEGRQFSKSEGWYIDLDEFFKKYSVDQIRYALAANAPESADSEFSFKDFQMRCNAELLGKLGNFVNRVLVFAKNHCSSKVPEVKNLNQKDKSFLKESLLLVDEANVAYSNFQLRKATQIIMQLAQLGNGYFDLKKPWLKESDIDLFNTIGLCLECIKNLALISSPIMPDSAQKMWEFIGYETLLEKDNWNRIKESTMAEGQLLKEPVLLFRKVENEEIEEQIDKLKGRGGIEFSDFEKIDIRVGQIVSAEKIEKSNKLLKLEVDLGTGIRQIVSGIAKHFKPSDLVGKKVLVVINLKPIKMMGVESNGMILAATEGDELELPEVKNLKPGSKIS